MTVLVDSTGLAPGVHEGHLCVTTNDPENPLVEVPVLATVTDQICHRTITGNFTGPLTVSSGLTCIAHGSVVTGPVSIGRGASIHVTGATVVGSVRADGAASVEVYGSKLVGPVTLRDGTKQVALIGNRVTGPVSVDRNITATDADRDRRQHHHRAAAVCRQRSAAGQQRPAQRRHRAEVRPVPRALANMRLTPVSC